MSAASQARRRRAPDDLEIVAFEQGSFTSYSACGIPYFIGGTVRELDKLIVRTPETFRETYSIDARLRHGVTEIDVEKGAVKVLDLDRDEELWEGYDQLLVATGATPKRPQLPGWEAEGIYGVQTLDDGVAIARA